MEGSVFRALSRLLGGEKGGVGEGAAWLSN